MTEPVRLHASTSGPAGYRLHDRPVRFRLRRGALWMTRGSDPLRAPRGILMAIGLAMALWAAIAAAYLILR